MHVIRSDRVLYCDVDDTLIGWGKAPSDRNEFVDVIVDGISHKHWVLTENVDHLRHHFSRGHKIVVWSQGGFEWAEAVVKALDIEYMIDSVQPKPTWILDDLDSSCWMPQARLAERKNET